MGADKRVRMTEAEEKAFADRLNIYRDTWRNGISITESLRKNMQEYLRMQAELGPAEEGGQ